MPLLVKVYEIRELGHVGKNDLWKIGYINNFFSIVFSNEVIVRWIINVRVPLSTCGSWSLMMNLFFEV